MRRTTPSITVFSFAASILAHAAVLAGVAYLVAPSAQGGPHADVAPGEASAGIGWIEKWDTEPAPMLAKLVVDPPPIDSIEPLIDPPRSAVTTPPAEYVDAFNIRDVEEEVSQIARTNARESRAPDSSSPRNRPGVRGDPTLVGTLAPHYPRRCRRLGHEGAALLECAITATGAVESVRILESTGCTELDQAAVSALHKARFQPARQDDEAVEATIRVPVQFRLGHP